MRQRRWMEYLEDYDFTLHYHPGKTNVWLMRSIGSHGEYWLVQLPRNGTCLKLWDSLDSSIVIRLRVFWGV